MYICCRLTSLWCVQVGPLQREHVLRLLHAPAFTRQLAGIKQLRDLAAFTFYQSRLGSEVLFPCWLCCPLPLVFQSSNHAG